MIDRLVHHAEVVSMKGDSYRLKDRDLGRVPTDDDCLTVDPAGGSIFNRWQGVNFRPVLTEPSTGTRSSRPRTGARKAMDGLFTPASNAV